MTSAPTSHADVQAKLGVSYTQEGSRFAVVAQAEQLAVTLRHPGTLRTIAVDATQDPNDPLIWHAQAEGDLRGWHYAYQLTRHGETLSGIVDPWATVVRRHEGFICDDRTPVVPRPHIEPQDAIIYELHVRDFTRHFTSGLPWSLRGTYLGLGHRGSVLEGSELPTGLDHILDLGVNTIQLMPVHGFAMPYDPRYEWGYMPLYFNAPQDTYSASVDVEAPVREFKSAISALHEAGLRVTLDVVYNHTAEYWPSRLRSLMALAPHEYFRFKDDGTPWDGSACGNEFRSESHHGRRFIVDSVLHWVREYGIDGYRFDLMGLIDAETMELVASELKAIDPTILVYGEPWAASDTPIKVNNKGTQRGRGWGCFNDEIRDALRGEVFEIKDTGFITNGEHTGKLKNGIAGSIDTFADAPAESINYVECHDNHTLADRLDVSLGDAVPDAEKEHMQRLAILTLAVSQGITFLHSGQEFARRKDGEDNTYNLGDEINNIDWRDKATNFRHFVYTREAIRLRNEHPMFRLGSAEEIRAAIKFLDDEHGHELPAGVVAFELTDHTNRDAWKRALIYLNGSSARAEARVLPGSWRCPTRDGEFTKTDDHPAWNRGTIALRPHSGAVLYELR